MSSILLRAGAREVTFVGARPWPVPPEGVWEFSDLVGWRGLTDDKIPSTERPQAHGAFETDASFRTQRAISFTARAVASSQTMAEDFIDDVSSMGAEAPLEIIVETDSGRTSRRVRVAAVSPQDRRNRSLATLAIDLLSADPRRYSVSEDVPWEETGPPSLGTGRVWPAVWPLIWPDGGSSGRITLTNQGKAPSAPEFELLGGFGSALITCVETGSRVGLDRFVPDGSVVEVNTAEHTATIDGQSDVSRWLRWREWELVPPGESRTFQFDATDTVGTPKLRGRVRSAWW